MTIEELAEEYKQQHEILETKIKNLKPLLYIYTGEDLFLLRKRIKIYEDMAFECLTQSNKLKSYYDKN